MIKIFRDRESFLLTPQIPQSDQKRIVSPDFNLQTNTAAREPYLYKNGSIHSILGVCSTISNWPRSFSSRFGLSTRYWDKDTRTP